MKTKHTPGPWMAQPDPTPISKDDWCIGVDGGPVDCVATCSERDARLIAAAPDGLEFAKWVMAHAVLIANSDDRFNEMLDRARAFITKATGNTL